MILVAAGRLANHQRRQSGDDSPYGRFVFDPVRFLPGVEGFADRDDFVAVRALDAAGVFEIGAVGGAAGDGGGK